MTNEPLAQEWGEQFTTKNGVAFDTFMHKIVLGKNVLALKPTTRRQASTSVVTFASLAFAGRVQFKQCIYPTGGGGGGMCIIL